MESVSFSEREVRRKLDQLGYQNIADDKMHIFLKDLDELIRYENSRSFNSTTYSTDEEDFSRSSRMAFSQSHRVGEPSRNLHRTEESALSTNKVQMDDVLEKENIGNGQVFQIRKTSSTSSLTSSVSSDLHLDVSSASRSRRKVARKQDGKFHVFDETLTENDSEASDITVIEDRLRSLPLREDSYVESSDNDDNSFATTSTEIRTVKPSLPSYIRTSTVQPHMKKIQKFDPVNRYHQFRKEWQVKRVPGESNHSSLRWNVREQMLSYEKFEKPRHSHKPNSYEVPTEKKRQALRWEVRSALARV